MECIAHSSKDVSGFDCLVIHIHIIVYLGHHIFRYNTSFFARLEKE